jgi:hypothetical protein
MKYITGGIFLAFLVSNIYVLHMKKSASVKRKAFRWWVGSFALFVLVLTAFEVDDIRLMVFMVPVIAWIVFASLRFTKFCEWCGRMVQTNLPFTDKKHCPRCGSRIS